LKVYYNIFIRKFVGENDFVWTGNFVWTNDFVWTNNFAWTGNFVGADIIRPFIPVGG